jgi:hypothetical protein
MSKPATLQLVNISQFHESTFVPALKALEGVRTGFSYDYAMANMLETIWWLQLGVELDYFSESHASKLLRHINANALKAFARRRDTHFSSALLDSALTMVDSQEIAPLEDSWFFRSPETLRIPFQGFLLITSTLGADPLAVRLMSACDFDTEDAWLQLMTVSGTSDQLFRAFVGITVVEDLVLRPSVNVDISISERRSVDVLAGFFKAIEFMAAVETSFHELNENSELEQYDLYLIRRRIGALQRWRFSMHLPYVRRRLEEISVVACRAALTALSRAPLRRSNRSPSRIYPGRLRSPESNG